MGVFGSVLHFLWIKRDLEKIFTHRRKVIEDILVNKNIENNENYKRNS